MVEQGFELLEDRVHKTAELVRALRRQNSQLEADLAKIRPRLADAEKKLQELEKQQSAASAGARQSEALEQKLKTLENEREEVRKRIGKLVQVLEGLEG